MKIEIIVSPKGETRVQTKGFTGSSCRDASRFIEQALGQRTTEQLTGEFHQTESTQQHQRQRSRLSVLSTSRYRSRRSQMTIGKARRTHRRIPGWVLCLVRSRHGLFPSSVPCKAISMQRAPHFGQQVM